MKNIFVILRERFAAALNWSAAGLGHSRAPKTSATCALILLATLNAFTTSAQLTLSDVTNIVARASTRAQQVSSNSIIAVLDREGFVLGVWSVAGGTVSTSDPRVALAICKAGTAAYLSSNQEALSSRSAAFIVKQHFPPGVNNKPPGPLVGVNFSNLQISDINKFKGPGSVVVTNSSPGLSIVPVPDTAVGALLGFPGGLPLFKNGILVGGIGVSNGGEKLSDRDRYDVTEDIALAGEIGYQPKATILGSHVFIDGIRVPYLNSTTRARTVQPLGTFGNELADFPLTNSPGLLLYPTNKFGNVDGEVRQPIIDDPLGKFTASDVTNILTKAAHRAGITRAGIRLPRGLAAQVWITVVNNPTDGSAPQVLGTFRTKDATLFSWDVAVQKARTALYFSKRMLLPGQTTPIAFSSRAVGFLAQSLYPPGIGGTVPGPFLGLQEIFSGRTTATLLANPLNGFVLTNSTSLADPELPNGITIFPGGFPLYKNGELIGAIGVSGDGIDQDDIIAASGTVDYLPPPEIRSDRFIFRGARLPYAKFPRNPSL